MEQKQIFRKASIDRVSSPEQLTDYIRVAGLNVWVLLAAVIILLGSIIGWAMFSHIEINRQDASGDVISQSIRPSTFLFGDEP